jgi:predicted DsbA family dithiol-disulfide isomerase
MSRTLRIDVWFDFVCPWCLIGKRQLGKALALLRDSDPDVTVDVHWRGVQLLPHVPAEGLPFADFYLRRLGGETAVRERQAMVLDAADTAGAAIDFASMHVMPNTADAHRLFAAAGVLGTPAQADELLERLFAAHFSGGADLGSRCLLLAEGAACGLAPERLAAALAEPGRPYSRTQDRTPEPAGAVPCFVFDGGLYLSGAQPPARLHTMMRQALAQPSA